MQMKTMESSLKLFIMLTTLLLMCIERARGEVVISPLGMAPACLGEQLELTCTTTGTVLEWKITLNDIPYSRLVSTTSATSNLSVSNIVFTFARTSSQNSLPLMSVLQVNPANTALNGSVVNCVNRETSRSSLTTIAVVDENYFQDAWLNLTLLSEQFDPDEVVIILEWAHQKFYSYNISTLPQLVVEYKVDVTRVLLSANVSYNTFYNMNVIAYPPCGQRSLSNFTELFYISCKDPAYKNNQSIEVIGVRNPAIEGTNISFICPPGLMLIGQNTAECMRTGEWEPDPKDVECKAISTQISGSSNQDRFLVLIVTSTAVCVFCSVICFVAGVLCRHYYPKLRQHMEATPQYEMKVSELYQDTQNQDVEFQDNVAYM